MLNDDPLRQTNRQSQVNVMGRRVCVDFKLISTHAEADSHRTDMPSSLGAA